MFRKMKNYVSLVLSVFVLVVNGKENIWSVKTTLDGIQSYNNCVQILNIPFDDVVKIEKITDPLNRRILKCVYIDMGFYTEGTGFHVDRMVKQFGGGDNIERIVKRCIPTSFSSFNDVRPEIQIIEVEECFKMEKIGGYHD